MGRRTGTCPFRKRRLIADDEAQSIAHEDPVCAKFTEAAHRAGKHEVRDVHEEAVGAHFDAIAARLARKRGE